MKVYVENIEDVKEWLEWAHQVHKTIQSPRPPKADISILGLAMPSHIWSNDADGQNECYTSDDIDNMWFIYENWFKGLSRREKLVVLLRSAKARWKTISWLLYENYHIFEGNSIATIKNDYAKALLKIYSNAR